MQVAGTIANSGTFNSMTGTIEMNGAASVQTISGSWFANKTINSLIVSNPFGVNVSNTLNDTLNIIDSLAFGNVNNTILNTGDNLNLVSGLVKSARVADITNRGINTGNGFSGKVTVERYIPGRRSWRMLTVPLQATGAPSLNTAWQEGVVNTDFVLANNLDPKPGYGMHISGSNQALGFDPSPLNNPSVKIYNSSTNVWSGIPNTLSLKVTDSAGYMVFVRGNRGTQLIQNVNATVSNTILRAKGLLKTGLQNITIPATTGQYTLVGNPYASSIDFSKTSKSVNVSDGFVIWDPNLASNANVGAFQYFMKIGANFSAFPGGGSYGAYGTITNSIQSGQAFLIQHAGAATLSIDENAKIASSGSLFFKPVPVALPGHVSIYAHYLEADNVTTSLVDGTMAMYDDSYSNEIDINDFRKAENIVENLNIVENSISLAIEKKKSITTNDTIYLKFSKVRVRKYRFAIDINNMQEPGLVAVLEDDYLKTKTPLSTSGITNYDFNIINQPDSYNPFRFKIVFKALSTLPVSFTTIAATVQNNDIKVLWKVADEINIAQYEIQKSTNGIDFIKIGALNATGNNNASMSNYQLLDHNPVSGNNFYRIKSIGKNGEIGFSSIAKINFAKIKPSISIYPNPVEGGEINLQMYNMPTGQYNASIFNNIGQLIYTQKFEHLESSLVEKIKATQFLVPGSYSMKIIKPDNTVFSVSFLNNN